MKKTTFFATFTAIFTLLACALQNELGLTNNTGKGVIVSSPNVGTQTVTQSASNSTILFSADSATLTEAAKAQLATASLALKNASRNIRIVGHADEAGSREYNLALGAQRAAAVRDFLVMNGILNSNVSISTVGQESPVSNCDTEQCKAQNRRAVIFAG